MDFKKDVNWELYLVTDRTLIGNRNLEEVVLSAVKGGVTVVQLREKDCSTREFVELAGRLVALLKPYRVPLIINDRVDVALAAQCQGVHVGQSDMTYRDVRRILGPDAIIGLSVETPQQAEMAENLDVDYLGVSPIFSTPTKTDVYTQWGIEGLKQLRKKTRHKLIAIGGIKVHNTAELIRAGADGVAVVSGLVSVPDPEAAAREFCEVIKKEKENRSL